jgi:hypothetical protein
MSMPRSTPTRSPRRAGSPRAKAFELRSGDKPTAEQLRDVHRIGDRFICDTEARGHSTPQGRSTLELVVDASEGFIPLWEKGTVLHWRFQERSMAVFANPAAAKKGLRELFAEALLAWGDAAPVKFKEDPDVWDFEIAVQPASNCNALGCVLARSFFPDAGRHTLAIFPTMFQQDRKEQIETLVHETGHVFGLRHFFALTKETDKPGQPFGEQNEVSIMNYGEKSQLTDTDRRDLKLLYQQAWNGTLTQINGTPVKLVRSFSSGAPGPSGAFAFGHVHAPARTRAGLSLMGDYEPATLALAGD